MNTRRLSITFAFVCATACVAPQVELVAQLSTLATGGRVARVDSVRENGILKRASTGAVITKTSRVVYLPVARNTAQADSLFGAQGFEAVTSAGLSFAGGDGAFYSEFLSDNLAVVLPLGYGRMGFGAFVQSKDVESDSTVAAKDDVARETAVERFVAAGGNAMFYYALPLVAYDASFNGRPTSMRAQVMFLPRVGLDVPALNAGTSEASGNLDLGLTLNTALLSDQAVFNIFGSLRGGWVPLASDDFYERFDRNRGFAYASIEGGVVLQQLIRIAVRGAVSGPKALREAAPLSVTVQLLPLKR